jgi:hypothetical protein
LFAGLGVTVAALAVGTALAFKTDEDGSDLHAHVEALPSSSTCNMPTSDFAPICNWIAGRNSTITTERTVRDVAFVTAAGVGVATGLAFLLWRPATVHMAAITPILNPGAGGVQVAGEF